MKEVFKYVNASQEALVIKYHDSFAVVSITEVCGEEVNIFISKQIAKKLIESLKLWVKEKNEVNVKLFKEIQ